VRAIKTSRENRIRRMLLFALFHLCGLIFFGVTEMWAEDSSAPKQYQGQYQGQVGSGALAYTFTYDEQGREIIDLGGIRIRPDFYARLDDPESGWATGSLSPDETRLIFRLGRIRNKNVWVLNLKRKTIEFVTRENRGRHLFIEWLDSNRFQLQYAGMGYSTTYTYQRVAGEWKITGEVDLPPEAFK